MKKKSLKNKLEEELDELMDVDEDSDLPISERKTKQKKILK
jgi:hypothetical protein|tara:strand:+ start:423 stop:545 length:123 start_codon:yes stop_codon:yes gene_type:complete